jgi:hypothetical protein
VNPTSRTTFPVRNFAFGLLMHVYIFELLCYVYEVGA